MNVVYWIQTIADDVEFGEQTKCCGKNVNDDQHHRKWSANDEAGHWDDNQRHQEREREPRERIDGFV